MDGETQQGAVEYYVASKWNKVLTHVTTWMNLCNIMLSEASQKEKDIYSIINRRTNHKQAHRYRDQTDGCQTGGGRRDGQKR